MLKVVIKRGEDEIFEVSDLTFDQVKELIGVNGYSGHATDGEVTYKNVLPVSVEPDYHGFYRALTPAGKRFFEVLSASPDGIVATKLATELRFNNTNQIGGLAGGSLSKLAKKFCIELSGLYTAEVNFENGVRTRRYTPGRLIGLLNQKDPHK